MNLEKIELLGICASPRKGNSLFLLKKAIKSVKKLPAAGQVSIEMLELRSYKIAPCLSCEACAKTKGECVIQDGFQEVRDCWVKADVILYSVPVYHLGIPGQLKCFLDRLGNSQRKVYEVPSPRRLKVVGVIVQGSHLFAGQELTIAFLQQHAVLLNCIPVSGDGWESYLGAAGWTRAQKETDALEKEYDREEMDAKVAVRACETLTRRCVEMAFILKAGGQALKEMLRADPAYAPFLQSLQGNHPSE
jgi:multimeric flavodoxin WrbA